jgi:cellulose synthase/poly-beta-1,6-N-acetylglucosamine synthase-like glycosyltransferase
VLAAGDSSVVSSEGRPRVTVVVPVRNGERYLAGTLRSVLAQTASHLEVIVVDDGSSDGTAAIVAGLAATDPRIRYVEARGQGVAAARNQGIELARAPLVAPLDADDLWLPTKLEVQLARLDQVGHDHALAYSWTVLIDADDRLVGVSRPFDEETMAGLEGDVFLPTLYKSFIANGSNPLMRRAAVEAVGGYDGSLSRREDWDLSVRLAERWPFALAAGYLVAYRQLPTGRSHGADELLLSHRRVLDRVRREHAEVPRAVLRWSTSECLAYAGAKSASAGRRRRAVALFARAVLLDPGQLLRPGPWQRALGSRHGSAARRLDTTRPPTPEELPGSSHSVWTVPFARMERRRMRRLRQWQATVRARARR